MIQIRKNIFSLLLLLLLVISGCGKINNNDSGLTENNTSQVTAGEISTYRQDGLTGYEQKPLDFETKKQLELSQIDKLGRATNSHIQLCTKQQPNKKREAKLVYDPVGWHNYKFYYKDGAVTKKAWLMNRAHLVGYQFSGLNSVGRNLVPMTAYLNQGSIGHMDQGNKLAILFYEQKLDEWLEKHPKYYLDYQVTPLYKGNELIPRQIRIAYVGYDNHGKQIKITLNSFREEKGNNGATVVYLDNISPNAKINYLTGTATNTVTK